MTSQTSSELFFNEINNTDIINENSDNNNNFKLEDTSDNSFIGNKRKLEIICDPYQVNETSAEPPIKKAKLPQNTEPNLRIEPDSTPNHTYTMPPPPQTMPPMHSPYLLLSPIMPHSYNPYMGHMAHTYPYPIHPYYSYPITHINHTKNELNNDTETTKRKRKNSKRTKKSPKDGDNSSNSVGEKGNNKCNKSPFKTTYISFEEEMELKTRNSVLYSQFDHARQTVYQRYQTKIEEIRRSNIISAKQRKLKMKIIAIDAKVREKKMFLNYSQMSKPNTNSWLISNTRNKSNNNSKSAKSESSECSNSNSQEKETEKQSKKRVKQPKFSECNVRVLRDWYETHTSNPYPSSAEKHLMCQLTGLTKYQVSRWFCNVRTRKPPPELSDNDEDLSSTQNSSAYTYQNGMNIQNMYAPYYANPQISQFHFGAPMPNISNTHSNVLSTNQQTLQMQQMQQMQRQNIENNMIGNSNDNSEGHMTQINSNFNIQNSNTNETNDTNLILPPLIDEQ